MNKTTEAEMIQRVLDNGKFVYVLFGVYSDRSASMLLGVFTEMAAAEDRKKLLKGAGSYLSVNYIKMPLNVSLPVELNP